MAVGKPADGLSTRRQFVSVIRLVVEVDGRLSGELVDPLSHRRQRFSEPGLLVEAVRLWIGDALGGVPDPTRQSQLRHTETSSDDGPCRG
jgi:hypothetical protein